MVRLDKIAVFRLHHCEHRVVLRLHGQGRLHRGGQGKYRRRGDEQHHDSPYRCAVDQAVDDVILRKPGRFTPEEYNKMKVHAAEGARVIHEILIDTDDEEFRRIAENVAHYHHERIDGSGYPDGLKGDEIPLEARIMAIADVYDALVSKRVYKESYSFERADQIILEGMGTQFDPGLKEYYDAARPNLEVFYDKELR